MAEPKTPPPAKLIVSIIFPMNPDEKESNLLESVVCILREKFGEIDFRSEIMPFNYTKYYEKEMGENLHRQFISFSKLVQRDELRDIKLWTNEIENKFKDENGRRRVNIDPGLLGLENLVLASCKNFGQRIYLGKGVFAEVTLIYRKKSFISLPWTFPDYNSLQVKEILMKMRNILYSSVKNCQKRR
jgi:hypothetical protein